VRLVAELTRPSHARFGRVQADQGGGGVGQTLVEPDALRALPLQQLVDEADVDDALAARGVDERVEPVDRALARQAMAPAEARSGVDPRGAQGVVGSRRHRRILPDRTDTLPAHPRSPSVRFSSLGWNRVVG
jgi:hypothetical protein